MIINQPNKHHAQRTRKIGREPHRFFLLDFLISYKVTICNEMASFECKELAKRK